MSIANESMLRGTPRRRVLLLRHFHPTVEFAGCVLVLALAGLTAVVSLANQGAFR